LGRGGLRSEARVGSVRYAVRPQCWCWTVGKVWSMPVRSQVVKKVGLVAAADSIQTCACLNYKLCGGVLMVLTYLWRLDPHLLTLC
jgi:hypothetical protein